MKRALITGGSSGIGEEFARQLSNEGYSVTLVSRNTEKMEKIIASLKGEHNILRADLTNESDLKMVMKFLEENHFDLLINNAGYGKYGPFHSIPMDIYSNIISLNVNALVALSHSFLKKATKGDTLINVSSVLSKLSYPGGAIYAATKGFVTIFSESLWYEYKKEGIFIMALLPGATRTNFHSFATGGQEMGPEERKISYSPDIVVNEAIKEMKKRKKPSFISGPRFRALDSLLSKMISRRNVIRIMGMNSPGMKKKKKE